MCEMLVNQSEGLNKLQAQPAGIHERYDRSAIICSNQPTSLISSKGLTREHDFPACQPDLFCDGSYMNESVNGSVSDDIEHSSCATHPSGLPDIDQVIITSFKHLLKIYSMNVNESFASMDGTTPDGQPVILAGGLQQYLIKTMKKTEKDNKEQPRKGAGSDVTTFHDLPDSLQLHIFSFIHAKNLCKVAKVCRQWYCLSCDDVLWRKRLEEDVLLWDVISHATNPAVYRECQSDWSFKEIYLRCSPAVNKFIRKSNLHHLSSMLRSLWPMRFTPRIAMFGPGLESSTKSITRKLLEDPSGTFKTTGMFPGQFEGAGSGFTMKMKGSCSFHLITLYTSTKAERESRRSHEERRLANRLLAAPAPAPREDPDQPEPNPEDQVNEVRQAIKDLCLTIDAFVFVVDAGEGPESFVTSRAELYGLVSERWSRPKAPLLVLSCVADSGVKRVPCIDVVEHLQLGGIGRPWQVQDGVVDSMAGVCSGFEWLVEISHRS